MVFHSLLSFCSGACSSGIGGSDTFTVDCSGINLHNRTSVFSRSNSRAVSELLAAAPARPSLLLLIRFNNAGIFSRESAGFFGGTNEFVVLRRNILWHCVPK